MNKAIILVILSMILISSVTALTGSEANLIGWYKFDESSGNFADETGVTGTATKTGTPTYRVGNITNTSSWAVYLDTAGDYAEAATDVIGAACNAGGCTFMVWANSTTSGDEDALIGFWDYNTGAPVGYAGMVLREVNNGGNVVCNYGDESGFNSLDSGTDLTATPHLFGCRVNATHVSTWVDGFQTNAATIDTAIRQTDCGVTTFGMQRQDDCIVRTDSRYTGTLDEASLWNVSLTPDQMFNMYSFGGLDFGGTPPPSVDFVYSTPATDTANNTNVVFSFNSSSGYADLYWGTTNPPTLKYFDNVSTGSGAYNWTSNVTVDDTYYYYACLAGDCSTNSTIRSWIYDTSSPAITVNSNNFFKSTNTSSINQYNTTNLWQINITTTDDNDLNSFLFNLTNINGTEYFSYLNTTLTGSATYTYTAQYNHTPIPTNTLLNIDIWASDSHTKTEISPYDNKKITNGIDFETAEGNHIWIVAEDSSTFETTKMTDRYSIDVDFTDGLEKKRVFHVYADKTIKYHGDKSGFLAHFTVFNSWALGGNWLDFETDGLITPIVTVKKISDTHFEVTFDKIKDKLTFNSIGGMNINHVTYQFYKGKATTTAPPVTTGTDFPMTLNLTNHSYISNIDAGLIYNGTYYVATKTTGTNSYYFDKTLNFEVDSDTTFNYTWNVTVTQADSSSYTFGQSGQHTIYTLLLDNCSVAKTVTAVFNLRDEDTITKALVGTMEIEGVYSVDGGAGLTKNITYSYTGNSQYTLCLYPNTTTIYSTAYIKYTIPAGFTHRYYWVNQSLNNVSKTFTLYNFNTTTGISDLKITLRNAATYAYYPNVYGLLQRKYVSEGVWRTVQMDKSGDFGQIFYNIKEEDTDYRLIYWDNHGNILSTSQSLKFVCSSGVCDLTTTLTPYSIASSSTNTSYISTFNNATNILNMSWETPDASSVTVETRVTRNTMTGILEICTSSQSGAAGTVNCNTTGYSGLFELRVTEDGTPVYSAFYVTDDDTLADYIPLAEGAIWTFAIMVTIIMFGLFSPVGVVISTILGLILIFFMGIFNPISLTFVVIAAVLGIAIGIKVRN